MNDKQTAPQAPVTERQKAWARLALLTVVGLFCPPLAAAKSGPTWAIYLLTAILYSLWALRVTKNARRDRSLGYLLSLADGVVLVPILVWSQGFAMRAVLIFLCLIGASTTWRADVACRRAAARRAAARESRASGRTHEKAQAAPPATDEAPLEKALRLRLRTLGTYGTRFALVILRVTGYLDMIAVSGRDATKAVMKDAARQGLRVLGADAQVFPLPGGRMAFVFATENVNRLDGSAETGDPSALDPHDTEGIAMVLGRKACELHLDRRRLECVVGWASAPADGTTADDLMYAAENGALSSAAFRRVTGGPVSLPEQEKKRAAAG